ncbi:MAG: type 1 glutamine amidotransferase [Acidimicrobiales bacterium]
MNAITIAVVYPDLLGTYGDGGNARILAQRLRWRGIDASVVTVTVGTPLPRTCDIYVLGGGEDAPQALAASSLREEGSLGAAVDAGAAVLAVCAGFQVIGTRFRTSDGLRDGAAIIDADSSESLPRRAVGELAVSREGLRLSGYENHAALTRLGAGLQPLGAVVAGVGNGTGVDGCISGKVLATYLHGPVLARNPEIADLVLGWVVGDLVALPDPAVDSDATALRAERLAATVTRRRWRRSSR